MTEISFRLLLQVEDSKMDGNQILRKVTEGQTGNKTSGDNQVPRGTGKLKKLQEVQVHQRDRVPNKLFTLTKRAYSVSHAAVS